MSSDAGGSMIDDGEEVASFVDKILFETMFVFAVRLMQMSISTNKSSL